MARDLAQQQLWRDRIEECRQSGLQYCWPTLCCDRLKERLQWNNILCSFSLSGSELVTGLNYRN